MGANARRLLVSLVCVLVPAVAAAQGSFTGVARDTSGAVLPGVTVEASSPALIEKSRSVVTDGSGQYRIIELRPGTYTVTFTLPGFSVVRREGVELSGAFTATVNAELRIGTLEETVTVTGQSPIVDVQSAQRQTVMTSEVLNAIPSGRTALQAAQLLPGVGTRSLDVGGTNTISLDSMSVHGSRAGDQRVNVDGLSTANADLNGQTGATLPNMGSIQELTIDTGGGSAEQATGGLTINVIPREGGNTFTSSFFATAVNSSFQGSNYTQELKDRGLRSPTAIKNNYDVNPSFGGPILRDRLWLFASTRWMHYENYIGEMFYNLNADNSAKWTYEPDLSRPAYFGATQRSVLGRITWQADSKNKFSFSYDDQYRHWSPRSTLTVAPDAATDIYWPMQRNAGLTWSAPWTNRLLFDAGVLNRGEGFQYRRPPEGDPRLDMVPVLEQSTGILYRAPCCQEGTQPYGHNFSLVWNARAAASYVTGAHAFKSGITFRSHDRKAWLFDNHHYMTFRFNNGVPNQLTQRATPLFRHDRNGADLGLYAQDRWTIRRLTLNLGVRFDYYANSFPEVHLGPAPLVPNRDITFPDTAWVSWKDVTPRLAAVYDLFGNGRTALKASINKFMLAATSHINAFGGASNPVQRMANFVTRSWNDSTFAVGDPRRGNFWPDCNLTDVLANGECGATSDRAFGQPIVTADVDEEARRGWGVRPYNWEFTTGVQHEVIPRVSLDVAYFRRWYGNFSVTDNRAISPSDFDPFSIAAPVDARLPGGGGYLIAGLYNLNPSKVGQVDSVVTLSRNFGEQIERWNGIDISANARLRQGLMLQGGVSSGRTTTDNCQVAAKVDNPSLLYCHVVEAFQTQVKFLGAYTIPRVDVQLGATFQSFPGPPLAANYNAPNALVQPSLGRPLSGGAANVTVNLVEPGTMYGERTNQLDLRVGKVLRAGRSRTSINLDIFNALNSSAVQSQQSNFAVWQQPQTILMARFAKISVQFDF
jgi:hypothetical protein